MGFLDSSSSIVTAILTRKGRELLAKNDGSFRITKFSLGDDEVNYSLYDSATEDDTNIRNLPVLEPSSNELTALRYRLVTAPKGTTNVGYLVVNPISLTLQNQRVANPNFSNVGTVVVVTVDATDTKYQVISRNQNIATPVSSLVNTQTNSNNQNTAVVSIQAQTVDGTTYIDIVGVDSGAIISVPVIVTSNN